MNVDVSYSILKLSTCITYLWLKENFEARIVFFFDNFCGCSVGALVRLFHGGFLTSLHMYRVLPLKRHIFISDLLSSVGHS